MNRGLLLVAGLLASRCPAQELWRIGQFDNSYDEFACARDYNAYAATFPHDVTYRIGVSSPKQDWSFVNPGPADAWAGSRLHPFTIEFDLPAAPKTPLRLLVDLVDVQGLMGASMGLRANDAEGLFHLKIGHEAAISDPAAGQEQTVSVLLPASLFRAGLNKIVLWSTGSWFLYDALSLSAEPGAMKPATIRGLSLEPTGLFKRLPAGGLGQVVIARIEVDGPPEGIALTVRTAGQESTVPAKPGIAFGTVEQELLIPEVKVSTPITVRAKMGASAAQAELTLQPERHWRIFIAPSAHTDIGYTDLQERVIDRHCDNTDRAVALCEKFPAFGWNLETAWQADMYRERRTSEQCERLYGLARAGRIGIQTSYLNMLTGLCSHEELNRWLYYAHSLKRDHGVPFESALTTDVPTQVWSIPSTLAAAGIRYFATGINSTRGYTFTKLMTGYPYWWEGPDGSRVLAYFAPGYAHAAGPLQSIDDLRNWIVANTRNRSDFPYDALFLYGAFSDNQAIQENVAATAQQWADQYEYPKLIVGPNAEYFKYMEATYGDKLPTVRGDGGHYWEDGAASSAHETTINRRAHESASAADALFAMAQAAGGAAAPRTALSHLWRHILLYDEHTWGAWCSISDPDSEQTIDQWQVKASFAQQADERGKQLTAEALQGLGSLVKADGPSLLLFNATGWEREGEVVMDVALPPGFVPGDPATGRPLPGMELGSEGEAHHASFRAPRIPPWGYVVCPLVKGELPKPDLEWGVKTPVIENEYLRVTVDAATGGIASVVDKATGRELVDQKAPYQLDQYLYVSGGDGTNIVDLGANKPANLTVHRPVVERLGRQRQPGFVESLGVYAKCEKTPYVRSFISLWAGSPRLMITNFVKRDPERKKEAAYFAFPFAATDPEVRLEIPNGVMRPELDQLPGACKEWYSMQHFARVSGREGSVAWASPDAPLVCIGDINRGLWQGKIGVQNGHLYSYVMNNYWFTNYKADQSGVFEFRYSLTPFAASDAEAARFGWQAAMPLQCHLISAAQDGPLPPMSASLCRVNRPGVMITAIKSPEVGRGLIIRLFSLESKPVTVRLTVGVPHLATATLCNLMEEPLSELPMEGSSVTLRITPQQPTTVWVR